MNDSIEIKWTETQTKAAKLKWFADGAWLGNANGVWFGTERFTHEHDLPESWKTEKPELYKRVRHFIWQHRELIDGEFLTDGELAVITGSGPFHVEYSNGKGYELNLVSLEYNAEQCPARRSWPRA